MSLLHGERFRRAVFPFVDPGVGGKPAPDGIGRVFAALDRVLRRVMHIREFCTDRRCVIRVAIVRASDTLDLSDGTRVGPGDPFGDLHLWNEQLPRLPWSGGGLAWALSLRRQFAQSFIQLAEHATSDPVFASIEAFRGGMTFAGGADRRAKVARVASAFGFEIVARDVRSSILRRLLDGIFVFFLVRAYNPACLKHGAIARRRFDLWISKRALIERYGSAGERAPGRASLR